jgi:hypothetical protein
MELEEEILVGKIMKMVPSNFNIDPLETDYQAVARFVISNVEFS